MPDLAMPADATATAPVDLAGALPVSFTADEGDPIPFVLTPAAEALTARGAIVQQRTAPADETTPLFTARRVAELGGAVSVSLNEDVDLDTPERTREAAAQAAALAARLLDLANQQETARAEDCCRLPGLCDGETHADGYCGAELARVPLGSHTAVIHLQGLHGESAAAPYLQAALLQDRDGQQFEVACGNITDRAQGHAVADALVSLAAQVRRGADTLGRVTR